MTILGNVDLALLHLAPSSAVRENLTEAAKASHRAAELCKQMLAYSGRGQFKNESINVNDIIQDMGHMLGVSVSKKSLLRYHLASEIPLITADATQIRQVIVNLAINASEAIADRSGVISVSTGVMWCDRDDFTETWINEDLPDGKYVYIEVADSGCGVDYTDLPKIFDPFFTTKFTGRGLGLAAVLGIIRGHRGAIKVDSTKGKGTTIRVFFPAVDQSAAMAVSTTEAQTQWKGQGTVLLVDDEESIRTLGKKMLEHLGFTVLTADNGLSAVEIFKHNALDVRCVLMDLTMPEMDGEEALIELRKIRSDVPVIVSSGYDEQNVSERLLGKGLSGFIQKPYRLASITAQLQKLLG
jgi:CheY-like chemotaxis protein